MMEVSLNDSRDVVTIMGVSFHESFFKMLADQRVEGRLFMLRRLDGKTWGLADISVDTILPTPLVH